MTHETEFGAQPYEKVAEAEFEVIGIESMKQAAQMQYRLMLFEPVLRVHVDYPRRSMRVVYLDPSRNTQKVLDMIRPARAVLKSRDIIEYDEVVKKSYHVM